MTESLSTHTINGSSTALLFNLDTDTSLQRLHRVLSDDEYGGEEEDRVELTNNSTDDVHLSKAVIDHLNHRCPNSPNLLTSLPSHTSVSPFSCARGRALKLLSMSTSHRATHSLAVDWPFKNPSSQESSQVVSSQRMTTIANATHHDQNDSGQSSGEILDFSFYATTAKIVFDGQIGYKQACQILQTIRLEYETTRSYADMWSFCLSSRTIRFYHAADYPPRTQNDTDEVIIPPTLIPIDRLLHSNHLFWLVFDHRPTFAETKFNVESIHDQSVPITNKPELDKMKFFSKVQARFSYGALTSMNVFHYHPAFYYIKETKWNIQFKMKEITLERKEKRRANDPEDTTTYYKSSLRAEMIDRAAIFTVHPSGFSVYICIKGNLREYKRIHLQGEQQPRSYPERISLGDADNPTFSTVCLNAYVQSGRRKGHDRDTAIKQIKELFTYLLDFFYANQIDVCFGSIKWVRGCLATARMIDSFSTPVQRYAFTMLRNVGYSVEQKLFEKKNFQRSLLNLAGQGDDGNDKFYRLCLHLFRRATEYHFLNLDEELKQAAREYQNHLDQCQALGDRMATILSPPRENFAYVPSIRITPTTIKVQPLKLIKLHRVIREKNFNDPMSLALVEIRDEANKPLYPGDFRSLREKFRRILRDGVRISGTRYNYLHHSMSQLKEKQFWFLDQRYSLPDVLSWMGNFDNEHVVAKHAARMAQCFTSTEPSIRIPAEHVKYISDIETEDGQYCFTDGVGTLSQRYFEQVRVALDRRFTPSVLQIRYGGCKGTVSMDPSLDNQPHQLIIRESMRKFMSDHDQLEICKVSSPRPLYLNRQDILLLSNRGIPDSHFLVLQNENHLWLVQALLCSSVAFELLHDRVGSKFFNFREIASTINLVEESFFLQLLITCGHDCVSKFQQRAKIKVPKNQARNMFGTVDEYGVLDYGEVFIQFSHLTDEKLEMAEKAVSMPPEVLDNVQVVITKNPCYHPGDLRTFTAVDKPELRHLLDVVVFPQKGPRPHPNEISGSDLDGDEYAVIWDAGLVPSTLNDQPYDYDSQEKPIKLDRPIERDDIMNIVLDIATQNLTGDMSNLHLAIADSLGTRHPDVVHLAGLISQELDAPKTGKHPITTEELHRYRTELLKDRYPDFMMREQHRSYLSEKIIGQLYRSARRALFRWHRAARTQCSLRHLHTAQLGDQHSDQIPVSSQNQHSSDQGSSLYEPSLSLDAAIDHPDAEKQTGWARNLFSVYRESLRNIISVFNYQDEIDLFCRCESVDSSRLDKQDLNISAGLELQRLIDTTLHHFHSPFNRLALEPSVEPPHHGSCTRDRSCSECKEIELARAAACYKVCYSQAAQQSTKARSRILSFPWLFSSHLTELKRRHQYLNSQTASSKYIVVGRSMRHVAQRLVDNKQLKLKVLWPPYSDTAQLFLRPIESTKRPESSLLRRAIVKNDDETPAMDPSKILFVEIMNDWIERQQIFGEYSTPLEKKPLIRELCWHELLRQFSYISNDDVFHDRPFSLCSNLEGYKVVFQSTNNPVMLERYTEYVKRQISIATVELDASMYQYSIGLVRLCFRLAREQKSNEYAYLSDYLILALQSIGLEKELNDVSLDIAT